MSDLRPRTYHVLVFRNQAPNHPKQYIVTAPDLPEWSLAVPSLGGVHRKISDSLGEYLKTLPEAPEPTTAEELLEKDAEGEPTTGVGALVLPVIVGSSPETKRLNITMDAYLLAEVDAEAGRLGMSRSAFLSLGADRLLRGG